MNIHPDHAGQAEVSNRAAEGYRGSTPAAKVIDMWHGLSKCSKEDASLAA